MGGGSLFGTGGESKISLNGSTHQGDPAVVPGTGGGGSANQGTVGTVAGAVGAAGIVRIWEFA
jgi:hypothetical protein